MLPLKRQKREIIPVVGSDLQKLRTQFPNQICKVDRQREIEAIESFVTCNW